MPPETDPNLIVGREHSEDAGVYRLTDELALIQTLDFFTPIVNDPFDFGRIAAANSLSDVYAMGGRPITVMNIVCFPIREMDKSILREILLGGLQKIREAGAALAGGHSIDDKEIKYGLSVSGLVHPDRILTNGGAKPGDALVLTKPLGTGILATAVKGRLASPEAERRAVEVMATLNKIAAETMTGYRVHACTDVTGFGLLGHGLEMAKAAGLTFRFRVGTIPLLPEVFDLASMGMVPAGSHANRSFCENRVRQAQPVDPVMLDLLADAQTSGGLLIALPPEEAEPFVRELRNRGVEDAAIIGEVLDGDSGVIELIS